MTRKKNLFWVIYALVFGISGIASIYSCFVIEENNKVLGYVAPILCAVAIAIGMVYLMKGYGKSESKIRFEYFRDFKYQEVIAMAILSSLRKEN